MAFSPETYALLKAQGGGGGGGSDLPSVTAADDGKVLEVVNGAWATSGSVGGYDAVIRLTHADNSGDDTPTNLTLSIVSGTYADLYSKFSDGGCPYVLVEYVHPWGVAYSAPMAYTVYFTETSILLVIAGYFRLANQWQNLGNVLWNSDDTLEWD